MRYLEQRRERKIEERVIKASETVVQRVVRRLSNEVELDEIRIPIGKAPKNILPMDFLNRVGEAAVDSIEEGEYPEGLTFDLFRSLNRSRSALAEDGLTVVFSPISDIEAYVDILAQGIDIIARGDEFNV